jgi:hypothetical protein
VLLDATGQNVLQELRTFAELGDSVYTAAENQLTYSSGLLEAKFPRGNVPAYQAGLYSLDPDSGFVIDPDFFEDEDFDDLERFTSSPAFEAPDGNMRLPWLAIYFTGRYKIKIHALDQNWFDLVRSTPEFMGGGPGFGGNAGDNFESPIFHVDGGIGLFGSAAVDSIGFFVNPR